MGDYNSGGGYHPGDFSVPLNPLQEFEICCGAILTQNTAWKNVRLALARLDGAGVLNPEDLGNLTRDQLAELIRPAGYFNQKSRKLQVFCSFYLEQKKRESCPTREELLSLWGIGPETADCMMLYAFRQPEFVIDAYTVRCAGTLGIPEAQKGYHALKEWFTAGFSQVKGRDRVELFQEFHALFVEHGKQFYSRKPHGVDDPLLPIAKGF